MITGFPRVQLKSEVFPQSNILDRSSIASGNSGKVPIQGVSSSDSIHLSPLAMVYGNNIRLDGPLFLRVSAYGAVNQNQPILGADGCESRQDPGYEKRLNFSWGVLKDTIPRFAEEMIGLAGQRKLRKHVCSEGVNYINADPGGSPRRSGDDTNSLKYAIANYVTLPVPQAAVPDVAEDSDDAPPWSPPSHLPTLHWLGNFLGCLFLRNLILILPGRLWHLPWPPPSHPFPRSIGSGISRGHTNVSQI
ncbi:hypothetical protein B0H13DRAFT_1850181 [Mycena leptocephala]|nr:hypothetical protein B0H13DRAFT_1850181 [Mycena leptocephala]